MAAQNLTPAEVTNLCTAAQAAWDKLGSREKSAEFKWGGQSYVATRSNFRLLVNTAKGEPVACRYD